MPHEVEISGREATRSDPFLLHVPRLALTMITSMLKRDGLVISTQDNHPKPGKRDRGGGHMFASWINETSRECLSINEILIQQTGMFDLESFVFLDLSQTYCRFPKQINLTPWFIPANASSR